MSAIPRLKPPSISGSIVFLVQFSSGLDPGGGTFDHHDGAQIVDIDNDGDLDIVSIGWNNITPRIFENLASSSNQSPVADAGPDQNVTLPTNSVTINGSGSDPDGGSVTFQWSQVNGPNTATLSGDDTADLTAGNLVEGTYIFRLLVTDDETQTASDDVNVFVSDGTGFTSRINSGGPAFNFNGESWQDDQYFSTSNTYSSAIPIANTTNDQLYQTERFASQGNIIYQIPVSNGLYDVNLHFAELYFGVAGSGGGGGAGSRIFNVDIENGQQQLNNYDIVVAAGGSATAVVESFNDIDVSDGFLTITFTSVVQNAKISGLEIFDAVAGPGPPTANAGLDQTITLPTNSLVLNGTGNDPDGGTVSFMWDQQSGPSTATLTNENTADLTASDLVEGTYVFRLTVTDDENDTAFDDVSVNVLPEPSGGFELRINTGGSQITYNGDIFMADQYFDVGSTVNRPQTGLPQPYSSIRYSTSQLMSYSIPIPNGDYTVHLHFAEIWFGATGGGAGGSGLRVFDVNMESLLVLDNLDIFDEVGAETMLIKSINTTVSDGVLNIDFSSLASVGGERHPVINAIEIISTGGSSQPPTANAGLDQTITLPTNSLVLNGTGNDPDGGAVSFMWDQQSGPSTATLTDENTANLTASDLVEGTYVFRLTVTDDENDTAFDDVDVTVSDPAATAIRINAGGPQVNFGGEIWSADQGFSSSLTFTNNTAIAGTTNDQLYQTERYANPSLGNFTYEIPVPNGDYDVNLHFAEIWIGAPGGGSGGVGSRIFNVDLEAGQSSLTNYDIIATAGGSVTAVIESFSTITVNDGSLTIAFSSVVENAKISGIEVLSSGGAAARPLVFNTEPNSMTIDLYPNPTRSEVNLETDNKDNFIGEVYIFDASGRLVRRLKAEDISQGDGLYRFNTFGMEEGIYFVKVLTNSLESFNYQLLVRK